MIRSSETKRLLQRYHRDGDAQAREELIVQWIPLVRSIARRYAGRRERFDDLFQVGMIGLIKAVDRFDPDRGFEFSTYATPTVLGEIKRHFRDCTAVVRVPRTLQELGLRVHRQSEALTASLGHSPTVREIAESLSLDEESVLEALAANRSYRVESLSVLEASDDEASAVPVSLGTDEPGFTQAEDRALLIDGFRALDERERRVVMLRHGFGLTQDEIARRVGCSQMHVSRVLAQANRKLERALANAEERVAA
ncbi:MAG TPA: SigB/SigF/SigG family RNA polymerase sigma factor [Gaiellaceae bacterium]|nr:SigB/SigF/SigG family RNA polymerase sigma factor [Gaiellaceae bacterium]